MCPALNIQNPSGMRWEDDTGYEMTARDVGNGRLRVTVVGDILVLDQARFASLLRSVDKAPDKVAEVLLDAREVRITEPLSLQRGLIRIQAQSVAFVGRGQVALTRPQTEADGIEILAQRLDVSKAQPVPIQVSVTLAAATPEQRQVRILTEALLTPEGVLTGPAARERLWRYSSNYDGSVPRPLPKAWNVNVGPEGYALAREQMSGKVAWPGYTSYKLRKHFTIAPFEINNKAQLSGQIDRLRPVFASLEQPEALRELDTLSLLMKMNLDDRGWGPAVVPSEDFVKAQTRFAKALVDADKQFPRLRTMILAAHEAPRLNVTELANVRSRVAELDADRAQQRANINEQITRAAVLQAEGVEIDRRIAAEQEESRQVLERLKDRDKDLAGIRAVTTVVAIGASFIGTPAAGAAIAATVSTAGDFVYAHNAGKAVNLQTLASIGEKNAALYKTLKSTRDSWDQYQKDWDVMQDVFDGKKVPKDSKKPLTKSQAAEQAGQSATGFAKQVKSFVDELGAIPKPDAVSLNDIEKGNGDLVQALSQLAKVQQGIGETAARLEQAQAALAAADAAVARSQAAEQVLLELKPVNDQEILRWKTAALQLWNQELGQLYSQARALRRSLFFETWKVPTLSAQLSTYPEELTAYLASGRYNPEAPAGLSPIALTAKHLDDEFARHLAVLKGLDGAMDKTWQDYLAERAAGARPYFDPHELAIRPGAPATHLLFLEQVNAQIREQIQFPPGPGVKRFPLLIPFVMSSPPNPDLPERLLRVGVANVRFKNPHALDGKQLFFDTSYRLAGELYRNGRCAYVDLAVPNGATLVTSRDQTDNRALEVIRAEAVQPLSFVTLQESRTAPPARTLYFLSIVVGGSTADANWKQVPEIKGFTFWRRIVQ